MAYGNYYGYNPAYFNHNGAMPDMLGQFKAPPPQQNNGLTWVQGETGAKSYMVGPGQSALLMDSESMRFYLKSADNSGMPQPLRIFEYKEVTGSPAPDPGPYITREEFEARISQILTNTKEAPANE